MFTFRSRHPSHFCVGAPYLFLRDRGRPGDCCSFGVHLFFWLLYTHVGVACGSAQGIAVLSCATVQQHFVQCTGWRPELHTCFFLKKRTNVQVGKTKMEIAKDRCLNNLKQCADGRGGLLSRARHERSRNRQCTGSLVVYGGRRHGGTSGARARDQGRRQMRSSMSLLLACLG